MTKNIIIGKKQIFRPIHDRYPTENLVIEFTNPKALGSLKSSIQQNCTTALVLNCLKDQSISLLLI